jgi:O-acetyl-ADP-ribose deacetylase (regulator of RNase III)
MTIEIKIGDVLCADAECIVNTTNSVGVMGKGVALRFKEKFPKECEAYNIFSRRLLYAGPRLLKPKFITLKKKLMGPKYIMFFATKIDWRNPSKLEYIERNLPLAFEQMNKLQIKTVAFPWPGCGNGGLDKADVLKIFQKYEHIYKGKIFIYDLEIGN